MSVKITLLVIFSIVLCISHAQESTTTSLRPTAQSQNTIVQYPIFPKEKSLDALILSVQEGFNHGFNPDPIGEGITKPYFLKDKENKITAVFKPLKNYRPESVAKEVLAYLLDQKEGKGFAGVPATTFVEITHPYFAEEVSNIVKKKFNSTYPFQNFTEYVKDGPNIIYGVLQQFVPDTKSLASPSLFSDEEARKIVIFDLRIFNHDRHNLNILVKQDKDNFQLIPIDHGSIFPASFGNLEATWRYWPQLKKEWAPKELSYISKINPVEDVEMVSKYFKFQDTTLRSLILSETVLKRCALAGVNLNDIYQMYRANYPKVVLIESLVNEADSLTKNDSVPIYKNELFFEKFEELLDKAIEARLKSKKVKKNDQ